MADTGGTGSTSQTVGEQTIDAAHRALRLAQEDRDTVQERLSLLQRMLTQVRGDPAREAMAAQAIAQALELYYHCEARVGAARLHLEHCEAAFAAALPPHEPPLPQSTLPLSPAQLFRLWRTQQHLERLERREGKETRV